MIGRGNQSGPTPGQINGRESPVRDRPLAPTSGAPGVFPEAIPIRDAAGRVIAAHGSVTAAD
jgi:hypothetical protein